MFLVIFNNVKMCLKRTLGYGFRLKQRVMGNTLGCFITLQGY